MNKVKFRLKGFLQKICDNVSLRDVRARTDYVKEVWHKRELSF